MEGQARAVERELQQQSVMNEKAGLISTIAAAQTVGPQCRKLGSLRVEHWRWHTGPAPGEAITAAGGCITQG